MTEQAKPAAVAADTYDQKWVHGMGGQGSNNAFVDSGGADLRPRLRCAMDLGALGAGLSVLDIGCGRGEVIIHCLQQGAARAVGIDYAASSLGVSRQNVTALGHSVNRGPLGLTCGDAKKLPFADESFDRIFMLDVVEHLHEWELQEVWKEVARVLRPGGYLVVHTLPNRWAMEYGYKLARLVVKSLPATPPDKRDIFHVNEQSVPSLAKSLRRGGLRCRVWLEDMMLPNARWLAKNKIHGEEHQMNVYAAIQRPLVRRLYQAAVFLPSRLWLATDLFALAWKPGQKQPAALRRAPFCASERLACLLGG